MKTTQQKPKSNERTIPVNRNTAQRRIVDNRSEAIAHRKLKQTIQKTEENAKQVNGECLQCEGFDPNQEEKEEKETQLKPLQKKENHTGLPDKLKGGVEQLSGLDISNVRVHYNSSKPAQVQAHAYTQGTNIHVAPGQEKHVPHEAWHVTQQMQGRVNPTTEVGGMPVNDNPGLENEADVMGRKAANI